MPRPLSTPVVFVTGVDAVAVGAATVSLQWDLPRAVVVQHDLDVSRRTLTRTVSDVTGLLEREELSLQHVCVSCATREDVVPTLDRLGALGRWDVIVARLPVTAEVRQVCRVLAAEPDRAPYVRVAATVVALEEGRVVGDLLGDDLVSERGLQTCESDHRGVGEVASAMVEYADVVTVVGAADPQETALLRTLARPGALVVPSLEKVETGRLASGLHETDRAEDWVAEVRRGPLPASGSADVWTLDLRSDAPFHPERLLEQLELIGGGARRSRGCFWLPSRPHDVCVWDGAGGQVSIGTLRHWHGSPPLTRLVVVGVDGGRDEVEAAFQRSLLRGRELLRRGPVWEVDRDGFEPWLGPVSVTSPAARMR